MKIVARDILARTAKANILQHHAMRNPHNASHLHPILPLPQPREFTLINWNLKSTKSKNSALNGGCIVDTIEGAGAVTIPQRTSGPPANPLDLPSIIARRNRSVQMRRLDTILYPVDHSVHVIRGPRSRLQRIGTAMSSSRDEIELVPICDGSDRFVVR
jgi:hypothetical protein